jgi:hypothetical protein
MGLMGEIRKRAGTDTKSDNQMTERELLQMTEKEKLHKNKLTETELLQMIAKDTNRTAKNVAFYFWITIISVALVAYTTWLKW